ncbi:MAG: glycosyltransferase [Azoarcus sp.]|jgi:glycosyltransferase involved in cell wall biosynthesis|nr:glycosyltransferase [Azoarcus sp.]
MKHCILFATADWDEPYWTNKQHTASELARQGWRVLYVESVGLRSPGMASRRNWKRLWRRLKAGLHTLIFGARQRRKNIWVLSPLAIPAQHHRPFVGWLNRTLLQGMLRRFIETQQFAKPLIWTYHPYMLDAIAAIEPRTLLYHCVDDLAAVPGVDAEAFRQAEQKLLEKADAVFATSKPLAEHCAHLNPNTHFLPNVADADHFGRALEPGPIPDDLAAIPEPRLVYHGVLSDFKVDFALLRKAAQLRPDWHWILIGEEREGQKSGLLAQLAELPNVHLMGHRSYETLPDYLRGIQVGILPSLINDYTRSMFPMKYFEYLAAGLPVVSTPLEFTQTHRAGLEIAQTAEEMINAVERQIQRGRFFAKEVSNMIADNTWRTRTEKMLETIMPGNIKPHIETV